MRYQRVSREDLVTGVGRQLRSSILTGQLQPGELLPPERDLAAQFGVDRHTLRSAISELEQLGLVERRQGSGCRVLNFRETSTLDLLPYLILHPDSGTPDPSMVEQAIDVARVTFHGLLALVVDRSDRADRDTMRAALDRLAATTRGGDPLAIIADERRFLRTVFSGAHSLVAELLVNTYDRVFDAAIDPEGRARLQWGNDLVTSGRLDAYAKVINAIDGHDHLEARRLVDIVLTGIPGTVVAAENQPVPRRRGQGEAG